MEYRLKENKQKAKEYKANKDKNIRQMLKLKKKIEKIKDQIAKAKAKGKTIDLDSKIAEMNGYREQIEKLKGIIQAERQNKDFLSFGESRYNLTEELALGNIDNDEFLTQSALIDALEQKAYELSGGKLGEKAKNIRSKEDKNRKVEAQFGKENKTLDFEDFYSNRTSIGGTLGGGTPGGGTPGGGAPGGGTPGGGTPGGGTPGGGAPGGGTPGGGTPGGGTPGGDAPEKNEPSQLELLKNFDFSKLGVEGINTYEDLENITDMKTLNDVLKALIEMNAKERETIEPEKTEPERTEPEKAEPEKVESETVTNKDIEDNWLEAIDDAADDLLVTVEDLRNAGITLEKDNNQSPERESQKPKDEIGE